MIDRAALLSDLQGLLRKLEADLLERTDSDEVPEVGEWLRTEYQKAKDAERTAHTYKQWLDDFITQVAAAWVLSCVFARFLEDNQLVDPPRIAGPGKRLDQARDEHTLYFQDSERAKLTDREYLLDIFDGLAKLPAGKDVFGPHNPMNAMRNWLGPDVAGELLRFFQKIDSDSGDLVHDFTDSDWDTRFLGDLYQDLSEAARKKYALLQTPDFVEEFILDRTLDPALDEFGLDAPAVTDSDGNPISEPGFRMIDPACGSGHFLLGAFPRILNRWQKNEPGTNIRELVQRTLHSIHGVDLNPFAIAITRFRLLLAAWNACQITSLDSGTPGFRLNIACGDSLYHGRERQQMLGEWTDEAHYFRTEDTENLVRILQEGTFHAVVANPPYITVKDKAANKAYRRLYSTCHMKYSLAVPFMERILQLGLQPTGRGSAYTGQITANSFMKREFGKKLIEGYFPKVDLSHVIDTQLAHIPGHGIPTVILFARTRLPQDSVIRVVGAIKREDEEPDDPAKGLVWNAILNQVDHVDSQSEFVSVSDVDRQVLSKHPWSIGGGGAADLNQVIEERSTAQLSNVVDAIGFMIITGDDELFVAPESACSRNMIPFRRFAVGDEIRDWSLENGDAITFMYSVGDAVETLPLGECGNLRVALWPLRTNLQNRLMFGKLPAESGIEWHEYRFKADDRLSGGNYLVYSFVATHNHFIRPNPSTIFNHSAMLCVLPRDSDELTYFTLLTLLNSSTLCFWMKQVCHCKGGGGIGGGIAAEAWERFYEVNGTKLKRAPLVGSVPTAGVRRIAELANVVSEQSPASAVRSHYIPTSAQQNLVAKLDKHGSRVRRSAEEMIRLQEDVDWECYRLYGLLENDLTYPTEQSLGIQLGERAFEIVMARKMAAGELQTTWFDRHNSTPITEVPDHWPDDYRQLVQRRIEVIETNKNIALIEQPECKRRWNTEPWESRVERALKSWLLDRLESYFDFDGRMNDEGTPTSKLDVSLTSVANLADIARQDDQFLEVAEVYRDDPAFDVQKLVEELVKGEHVPLLPVLRYKANGLRNRAEWEKTWDLQRLEDKLRAEEPVNLADYELSDDQREAITTWQEDTPSNQKADCRTLDQILSIPVPPKYKSGDFISIGGARYWALRGKLDVPKERWVSFPHCEGPDGTLLIAWAGYNHLQLAQAISAYYVDVQERLGGRDDTRLVPLLASIIELLPWLKQWHHGIDPEYNQRMDEVFEGFVTEEAKALGQTIDQIKAWQPPKRTGGKRRSTKK